MSPVRSRVLTATMLVVALSVSTVLARAQDLTVEKGTSAPPTDIAQPISALLAADSTRVMRGANALEFWWVKALPLKAAPSGATSWADVPEGALVGVLTIAKPMTDIRGLPMKPGTYTLRFALQPADGDHTGVSPYRQFLLVCPAALDQTPDPLGFKGTVALAKKTNGSTHPSALSMDPPSSDKPAGQVITNEAGLKAVTFSVPTSADGKPIQFGLILVGTIEHQM
jgi:hypothetical protein